MIENVQYSLFCPRTARRDCLCVGLLEIDYYRREHNIRLKSVFKQGAAFSMDNLNKSEEWTRV